MKTLLKNKNKFLSGVAIIRILSLQAWILFIKKIDQKKYRSIKLFSSRVQGEGGGGEGRGGGCSSPGIGLTQRQ